MEKLPSRVQVEQLSSDLRNDLFTILQWERAVVPQLVAKCTRNVRQIELVIPCVCLKGLKKAVFGATDDAKVVSDRLSSFQSICGFAPGSVHRDIKH